MTPTLCKVRHDPPHTYGDCVRACVATILNRDDVPHFCHDDPTAEVMFDRLREYLKPLGLAPWVVQYGPDPIELLLDTLNQLNPDAPFILFGNTGTGDHAVVCQGGRVVHNPAWGGFASSVHQPHSMGLWIVLLMVAL